MQLQGIFGLIAITLIAWLISENRRAVPPMLIISGLGLQFLIALLLLKLPGSQLIFGYLNDAVIALETATMDGTRFVFGFLAGGELPFDEARPGSAFILAFRALPMILVMSALSALLFHWRVLPRIVRAFSLLLEKSMATGGALGLGAAANVFLGMVESPLLIRPYLARLTRSELFALMSCGMATIAGTMLALYASLLGSVIPNAVGHILTASLISAPAALMLARIMVPEKDTPTPGELSHPLPYTSSMDAVTYGTLEGLKLLANIVAMLIVLIALVSLANQLLGLLPQWNGNDISLQQLLGIALAPLAWLIGIPWSEAQQAGSLLGVKTVLNELVAYLQLAALSDDALSERSRLILSYALCGFANLGSLGILIGGLGTMVPERRQEIVSLGTKSILSGTLATCLTGAVVGLIY